MDEMGAPSLVVFPPGTSPANGEPEGWAAGWGVSSFFMDVFEMGLILIPLDFINLGEVLAGAIDMVMVGVSCVGYHECYYGQPSSDLPPMYVFNQDFMVTATDTVVGPLLTPVGDFVTSLASAIYDVLRLDGELIPGIPGIAAESSIPNFVSLGISPHPAKSNRVQMTILVYP